MAVYAPALMLQPVGSHVAEWGFAAAAAYVIVKAVIAVTMWGVTAIGFFLAPVSWPERIIAFLSAALLVVEYPWTDPAGFAACGVFLAYQFWKARRARRALAAKPAE
jgi:TRAP-type uncharacterized transport system fused permease subunit